MSSLRSCSSLAAGNEALLKVKSEPKEEERVKMDAKKKDGIIGEIGSGVQFNWYT